VSLTITEDQHNELMHYGILRRSGRYPWGSGENVEQRSRDFLGTVEALRKQGMSDTDIAKGMSLYTEDGKPWTTTEFRAARSIASNAKRAADIAMAQRLHDKGYSNSAIAERMFGTKSKESTVRSLLAPGTAARADILQSTRNMVKARVDSVGFVDVGLGNENHIGVSADKLRTAVAMLKEEGYSLGYHKVLQQGTGKETTLKVLRKPGVSWKEAEANKDQIQQLVDFSNDGGHTYHTPLPPISISSKRVDIRYAEDGGADADGVIYVRPGVKDVSLGESHYAQVRVAVNGTHYLKGMAIYKDDLPDGVDLVFNTNKHNTGNKLDAMKPMKQDKDGNIDSENPFTSSIKRQLMEKGADGKDRVTSVMNIVREQGDWEDWSKNFSSQFLSKQSPALAKTHLDMTFESKKAQFDEIMSLTNPTIRRKLLMDYADDVDASAVHLKAAIIKRTANHVILPVNSMKETEVYAPNYRNGERVVLVRHPHGGTFEIPELTVNNNHPEAKKLIGRVPDAIGIHAKVAERLSGADFDGDTVLVIPNPHGQIKTTPALEGLKGFNPRDAYPAYEGMPKMTARTKQIEMGNVSNLITDMTIRGASHEELARAVRHSMVVIDAEKHNLNYKQSALDNGIAQLKKKYQGGVRAGASTLISQSGTKPNTRVPVMVPRRAAKGGPIDKETGKKVFEQTGETYIDKSGKLVVRKMKVAKLAFEDDAYKLIRGTPTPMEDVYASHSNRLKALANQARKEAVNTRGLPYSPSAKQHYSTEVAQLNAKLDLALRNKPKERQAQLIANSIVKAKRDANPDMDDAELKKVRYDALREGRDRVGAQGITIKIEPREWEAIQAGAVTDNLLSKILQKADMETVKQLATPKSSILMTSTKRARADAMIRSGYTQAEIADALGVSLSTLKQTLAGD
jgi:hypothetical protein